MLQLYVFLKIHFSLKSVILRIIAVWIELQYVSTLRSGFKEDALITFCANLPVSQYSGLPKFARNLTSACGSTYTCIHAFSRTRKTSRSSVQESPT